MALVYSYWSDHYYHELNADDDDDDDEMFDVSISLIKDHMNLWIVICKEKKMNELIF